MEVTLPLTTSSPNPTSSIRSGPNDRLIGSSQGPSPGPAVSDQATSGSPCRFCSASSGENVGLSGVGSPPPPDCLASPRIPCATPLLPLAAEAGEIAMSASWSARPPSVTPLASTFSKPNNATELTLMTVSSSGPDRR
jgi:hypothetical protein